VHSQPKDIKTKMRVLNKWCKLARHVKAKELKKKTYLYIQNINIRLTTFLFLLENFYTKHRCCSVAAGCVLVFGITGLSVIHKIEFKVCKSIHHRTIQINYQPDATIFQCIILTFIYSSSCSGHFPAHHQRVPLQSLTF
jgi:hypothetical protein